MRSVHTPSVRGPLVQPPGDPHGCTAGLAPGSLAGSIAIVRRGRCTFRAKADKMSEAGASAMVVVNNVDGSLFSMTDDTSTHIELPSVLVGKSDGATLEQHALFNPGASTPTLPHPFSRLFVAPGCSGNSGVNGRF